MERKVFKISLDSELQIVSICSIRILNILEVIAQTTFSKIEKMLDPGFDGLLEHLPRLLLVVLG